MTKIIDNIVRIDFETRSPCDLNAQGAWVYSRHPNTEILCLASELSPNEPIRFWVPELFNKTGTRIPDYLLEAIERGDRFESHGAFFEQCLWWNICVARWGWPEIPLNQWQCSASSAALHALPRSLDGVSRALGLSETKDTEGRRVMLKLSKPRKPSKHNKNRYHCDPKDYKKLHSYCKQDVRTESAVSEALGPLPPSERQVWLMDQRINFRGVRADRNAILGALTILEQLHRETNAQIRELTAGEVTSINQSVKLKEYLNSLGLPIEGIGKPVLDPLVNDPTIDPLAREIIDLRLASAKSSTAKYKAMLTRMDTDDRMRELILYHGAHSGRWTGLGAQIQNYPWGYTDSEEQTIAIQALTTGNVKTLKLLYGSENVMTVLSNCLRGMLCAEPENRFLCADFSGIENRFLFWLCGETEAVETIRSGGDLYKDLASTIFSKSVNKINKVERDLGKRGILGAGYQMGATKFRKTCAFYGTEISQSLAEKTIRTYRTKYKRIPQFWRDIEKQCIKACLRKNTRIIFPAANTESKLLITCENDFLTIKLPSGRKLYYYKPQIHHDNKFDSPKLTYMGVDSYTRKWVRQSTYGGKLTENIVQAACRDILAEAMLRLENMGYPIVLTVHDEIVSEVKKTKGTLNGFCDIMSHVPKWCPSMPINVEGWEGQRFRKQ